MNTPTPEDYVEPEPPPPVAWALRREGAGTAPTVWCVPAGTEPDAIGADDVTDANPLEALSGNARLLERADGTIAAETPAEVDARDARITLEAARYLKGEQIAAGFAHALSGTVAAAGYQWNAGQDSCQLVKGALDSATLAGAGTLTLWPVEAPDAGVQLTPAQGAEVVLALSGNYGAAWAKRRALEGVLARATSADEIEALALPDGWRGG